MGISNVKAARALSAEKIQKTLASGMEGMRFRPAADEYVISNDLYSLYQSGRFNDTPILLGHTSDETASFGGNRDITPGEFEKQIRSQYGSHADILLGAYPHSTDAEATKSSRDIRSDSSFSWNTWTWSRLQTQKGKGKVFQYLFDYHPGSPDGGSGHGSDVPYAFQTLGGAMGTPKQEDLRLSDVINSYWINFARNGNPNGEGLPEWPVFDEKEQRVMYFGSESRAMKYPDLDRLMAFDAYYAKLRESMKTE